MTDDVDKTSYIAQRIAAYFYGGVEAGTAQWERCMGLALDLESDFPFNTGEVRFKRAGEAFEHARRFNKKYPRGADGFIKNTNGERVLVRVDAPAMMYPDPACGEIAMAWFYPLGWRLCDEFEAKNDTGNAPAQELMSYANAMKQQNRNDMAEHFLFAAVHADPDCWRAMNELGIICHVAGRYPEAIAHFADALAKEPQSGEIYNNRALVLRATGAYRCALDDAEKAMRLLPGNELLVINRAALLDDLGRTGEALDILKDHIARRPDKTNVVHNTALTLLNNGRFEEGWPMYGARLAQPTANAHYEHFAIARWQGEDVSGKNVLVWTEQGLGDEILTASMVPDLVARGASVTLLCSGRMWELFRVSMPNVTIALRASMDAAVMFRRELLAPEMIPGGVRATTFDFQASQGDLGQYLRPTLESFRGTPFLKVDKQELEIAQARIACGRPRVGISWHSRKNPNVGMMKGTDLKQWEPILRTPGVNFVSLQYGDCAAEIAEIEKAFGITIEQTPVNPLGDMYEYAALVKSMDLVITVSNTAAHLAGGLGVPTWVMVPDGGGRLWYWLKNSETSPWYASARLFRQRASMQWAETINEVAAQLAAWKDTQS